MFMQSALEQGLIFGIMALGVLISYKILDFPDLSVDGSFPLGASVAAAVLVGGHSPVLALILAAGSGAAAGLVTGFIHTRFRITHLLSGIIVMIALYSVNLRVMGGSANQQIFQTKHLFSGTLPPLLLLILFALGAKLVLDFLLRTQFGFALRALGDNPQVVTNLGINADTYKILGLMVSGALIGLSGALMAQSQGFADVGMGTGMLVIGLAAIIMGETLFSRFKGVALTTVAIVGAIIYRMLVAGALMLGLPAGDMKLITAVLLLGILILQRRKPQRVKLAVRSGKGEL